MSRGRRPPGKGLKRVRGLFGQPVLWVAIWFNLTQIPFALIGALAAALTELPFFIGSIISTIGGDEASLFFWALSVIWIWVGFMVCALWLLLRGTKLFSGEKSTMKWLVFLMCWVVETLPFGINAIPLLTFWVWYVLRHPE